MEQIKLQMPANNFFAEINLPTSKSISNRLLIIRALSGFQTDLQDISEANDSILLRNILSDLPNNINETKEIDAKDAGTVVRFLTAFLSIQKGNYILKGSTRMHQRPIRILVNALQKLGAKIEYLEEDGFLPLLIKGTELKSKKIQIDAHISSQYITALLLISPYLPDGLDIELNQTPSSLPYIDMTLNLMQSFGIIVTRNGQNINVRKGAYQIKEHRIEADWSAAAFWYQCVAFSEKGSLLLKDLSLNSIQGDAIAATIFTELGVQSTQTDQGVLIEKSNRINYNINLNFKDYPDIALSIINTCAALGVIGKFSGLNSLKIKESNRVAALESELGKLGFDFREVDENEWVLINSCKVEKKQYDFSNTSIATYNDHRIAMSFAPFAILGKELIIQNPNVVDKSYPHFWKEFKKL